MPHFNLRQRLFPIFGIARQSMFNCICSDAIISPLAPPGPVSDDRRLSKISQVRGRIGFAGFCREKRLNAYAQLQPLEFIVMIMQTVRAPVSHPINIDDLCLTEMTVGYRQIETNAARLKKLAKEKLVRKHVIPVVKGPKGRLYVIDHHHLCRALLLAGLDQVSVVVVMNLERLEKDEFWIFMDNRGLVHPFDADGKVARLLGHPEKHQRHG